MLGAGTMIFSAAFLIQSSLQQLQASTTTDERGDETLSPEMADAIHDLQEQLKDVTDIRYEGQFEADVIHGFGAIIITKGQGKRI